MLPRRTLSMLAGLALLAGCSDADQSPVAPTGAGADPTLIAADGQALSSLAPAEHKLTASDGAAFDIFGISVSISGNRALVGANQITGTTGPGAAYVFERSTAGWIQVAKLTAFDGALGDRFGASVSLDGDRALVGAWHNDSGRGSAYVFEGTGTSWSQVAKLTASDGALGDGFGISVSLDGDRAVVGATKESKPGAAYVFERSTGGWSEVAKLTASDGALGDGFGGSVSLDGDRALVGAWGARGDDSAYIFEGSGMSWSEVAKLTASDGAANFGGSVSLDGDRALVGASGDDSARGSAYVFEGSGTSWSEVAKLTASDGAAFDAFGSSVSLDGDRALVGAPFGESGNGSAYVFGGSGTSWNQVARLTASDGAALDRFGVSVSLDGDRALVGAWGDDSGRGSAYVFDITRSALADLADAVNELRDDDVLNGGQAHSLLRMLDHVSTLLERGNEQAALNKLDDFIEHVEGLVFDGVLTETQGEELIDGAELIKGLIGA